MLRERRRRFLPRLVAGGCCAAGPMTRKDSEKDTERPHYYSQFWLDVAAGRRVIGSPRPSEETETAEREPHESAAARKPARGSHAASADGHEEPRAQVPLETQEVEPPEIEEASEPDLEEAGLDAIEEDEIPTIEVDQEYSEDVSEESLESEEELEMEEESEPELDEEEEELYEEDEDIWPSGKGKKKPKPGRTVKPVKRPKRDTRRPY